MGRTANPNTPEDGVQVATKLTQEDATKARLASMVEGKSFSDWLRDLILAATNDFQVQVTRNGKQVSIGG
jgi:regulation of enolase protein 1 (concanavalin A-like superfamily)